MSEPVRIRLPDGYKAGTFLDGIPIIGPQARVLRASREILRNRIEDEYRRIWGVAGYDYHVVDPIIKTIVRIMSQRGYFSWPNHYFYPCDSAVVVLVAFGGMAYEPFEPMEDVRKAFKVRRNIDGDSFFEMVLKDDMAAIVAMIVREGKDPAAYEREQNAMTLSEKLLWGSLIT